MHMWEMIRLTGRIRPGRIHSWRLRVGAAVGGYYGAVGALLNHGSPAEVVAGGTAAHDRARWQFRAGRPMLPGMDTAPRPSGNTKAARPEIEAARQRRLAWEADMIAEARASAAAGRVVSSEAVDAWIDGLDTDHELPAPRSGR